MTASAFNASGRIRSYLSVQHLYAAKHLARDTDKREQALAGRAPQIDLCHQGLVLASITESVAFIEAVINEVFADATQGRGAYVEQLPADCRSHMSTLWKALGDRLQPLDKYNFALSFASKPRFKKGVNPYQNAKRLIDLRNYIVHYKPHDRDKAVDDPHKHEKALKGKFLDNALMSGSNNPWFPDHAFGAGCTKWACESALSLTRDFAKRMDLRLAYEFADFGDLLVKR